MKIKKSDKNRGLGMRKVPFYCDSIISCLDLTIKIIEKIGFPEILGQDKALQGQLCFDLALTIQDRIEENYRSLSVGIEAVERKLWEASSINVSLAYENLDSCSKNEKIAQINEDKARTYCESITPDSVLHRDPNFRLLWKSLIPSKKIGSHENVAELVETVATQVRQNAINQLLEARDKLSQSKLNERSHIRSKIYKEICNSTIDRHEALFDFSMGEMVRLSDASQRLVLLNSGPWLADFWISVECATHNSNKLSIESFALRRLRSAQFVLDKEIERAERKNCKANRPSAFSEWAIKCGSYWGIHAAGFDYNAQYNRLKKQDQRVDTYLAKHGFGGLKKYLGSDKITPYLRLESLLSSDFVKDNNHYSALSSHLRQKTIQERKTPMVINLCAEIGAILKENSTLPIIHLENSIGPIFKDSASLIRKIGRILPIRLE